MLYSCQTFNSLATGASPKPIKVKASYNAYLDSKADEIYKEIARRMKAGIESESATTTTTTTTTVSSSEGLSETQKAAQNDLVQQLNSILENQKADNGATAKVIAFAAVVFSAAIILL